MQIGTPSLASTTALDHLRLLEVQLRTAIRSALEYGRPHLAVSLDTARASLEAVLDEENPKSTRVAVARARAEIALEVWREACAIVH